MTPAAWPALAAWPAAPAASGVPVPQREAADRSPVSFPGSGPAPPPPPPPKPPKLLALKPWPPKLAPPCTEPPTALVEAGGDPLRVAVISGRLRKK